MISHGRLNPLDREMILCLRESRSVVRRTFSQWLTDVLVIPSGPYATFRFEFERQPVTQLWADCIDSGLWTEYVHTGPSQYGKSLLGYIAPLIYHLHELREHCVMGVPMADMAAAKWERDILPVLQASPELRQLIPTTGSGSSGGKIRDMVTLGNGQILKIISAGGDDVNKASFTSRVVAITEAARFSEGAESSVEAEPFAQLQARQRGYTAELRRTFVEGTLTIEEELPWSLREHSTKSRIVTPCPHCRAWITPGRANLMGWQEASTDREARDKAYFVCPDCSKKITGSQRKESVAQCRLVHDG
jgi:phage terminase large subunit GpA-like protein